MAKGVYKRTEAHNKANSLSKRGIKRNEETRKRMSIAQTGTKKPWITTKNKETLNEKHWAWKGDKASYNAKHKWVEKRLGKPHYCEHCKRTNLKHRQYHWANVSRNYLRIVSDWIRLCAKCHAKYDA